MVKITVEHTQTDENEIVLRCREVDDEMLRVLSMLRSGIQKICAWDDARNVQLIAPGDVVYCETVSDTTFVYTQNEVYKTALSLFELEGRYSLSGFFRAGKSAVMNLHHVRTLKSRPGGRIEATMTTGEKIVISRHYAPFLHEKLEF